MIDYYLCFPSDKDFTYKPGKVIKKIGNFITLELKDGSTLETHKKEYLKVKPTEILECQVVITGKLSAAKERLTNNTKAKYIVCEDTGLYIEQLDGLPGALVKMHLDRLGPKGLLKLAPGSNTIAETVVGCLNLHNSEISIFIGQIPGKIDYLPSSKPAFGWDGIFVPTADKDNIFTYADMTAEQKHKVSPRDLVFLKLPKSLSDN